MLRERPDLETGQDKMVSTFPGMNRMESITYFLIGAHQMQVDMEDFLSGFFTNAD